MTELKSYKGDVTIPIYGTIADTQVYLKNDADEVIAEKDKIIDDLKHKVAEERSAKVDYKISARDLSDGLREAIAEIRHHKYQRCLDNARWCRKLRNVHALMAYTHRGWKIAGYYGDKAELYRKWNTRWLELAEKF